MSSYISFSPTSSTTSYSPLSVTTTACKYSCVIASKCLHTFPFSPTSSTTSYYHYLSQQQSVSIIAFMHLCLHTFPFSPTSSTTSYSPLSVTTTACKYSCVIASKCLHTFLFRLLPPRHLIHYYLSQQQPVSILVLMHLNVFIHFLFRLLPPRHLITTICHNNSL